MKNTKWFAKGSVLLAAASLLWASLPAVQAQEAAAAPASLSPGAAEVVKLAGAGTGEEVMLAYVKNSAAPFGLSADQILYLRDLGLSSPVIAAMLERDKTLSLQPSAPTYDQRLYAPTVPPPAAPAPVAEPAPEAVPAAPTAPAPAAAPAPVYVSSPPPEVSSFYSGLAPYGTWIQLEGVGWCWQPTVVVVNRGWQPYCHSGHWVYTDAGWYWESDYSWGWAPFHYGRWHMHPRCGWVWLPDRVWGPAWVTWRYDSGHCGWAPLPPHADFDVALGFRFNGVHVGLNFDFGLRPEQFTFVAMNDFTHHDLGHRRLPPVEVTKVYNHTTIINNYVVVNKTIVNQGFKVEQISAATHTQIRKAAIRDLPAGAVRPAGPGTADKGGLVVYRPELKAPARTAPMVAQKVDDRHPIVHPALATPGRADHRTTPVVGAPATGTPPRKPSLETPKTPAHPAGSGNTPSAPRSYQPAPSAPATPGTHQPAPTVPTPRSPQPAPTTPAAPRAYQPAPAAPSAPKSYQPAPAAPSVPTAPRKVEEPKPSVHPTAAPTTESAPHTRSEATPSSGRASASGFAPHVYPSKGYQQAADVHALPPSPRQPDSATSHGKDSNK